MKAIFLVLFFLTTFFANAQSSGKPFRSGSIELKYRPSLQFYVFNDKDSNKAGCPGWLIVNVKYDASNKKKGNNTVAWLDDVTMKTEVVIPGVYKSKNVIVLLTGKTVFWSIPMDGKKHQAVACIPPQVIARFARKGNKIAISKIIARVTFYDKNSKPIMRLYSSSGNRIKTYFSSKVDGAISSGGMLTVEDIIMPRNKTPWGVINFEFYDLIKPDSQK